MKVFKQLQENDGHLEMIDEFGNKVYSIAKLYEMDNFDYKKVAKYDEAKISSLLDDAGIIRNKLKVRAAVSNAQAFMVVQQEFGSFKDYIWSFVDGKPLQNGWNSISQVPPKTDLAESLSKDLKKRGFKFVGPTVVYAHMQATGMVNDHTIDCFRHKEVQNT